MNKLTNSANLCRYTFISMLMSVLLFIINDIQAQTRIAGDPIPGVSVKVGRKPPGGNNIMASGKTDEHGEVEFKNIPTDVDSIFFIFELPKNENQKAQSQRWAIPAQQFENNEKAAPKPVVKKFPEFEVSIQWINTEVSERNLNSSKSNVYKKIKVTAMNAIQNMK